MTAEPVIPLRTLPSPAPLRDHLPWHARLEAEYETRTSGWSDIVEQMPLLRAAATAYDLPVIAELGTRTGNSTCALLAGASVTGGRVYSVDIGPVQVPDWWAETGMWWFLTADDLSDEASLFIPSVLDVLFIDTSHLYEQTLGELFKYVPRVRPGGIVLCHDVELTRNAEPRKMHMPREGLMGWQWLEDASGGPEYPVAAALDVYCEATGLSWERQPVQTVYPHEPFYGLGTIRIPSA